MSSLEGGVIRFWWWDGVEDVKAFSLKKRGYNKYKYTLVMKHLVILIVVLAR